MCQQTRDRSMITETAVLDCRRTISQRTVPSALPARLCSRIPAYDPASAPELPVPPLGSLFH